MPNLSAKELSAIGEQLELEQMLVYKYQTLATSSSDPQIKMKFENIASKHQQHYNQIKTFLS